MGWGNDWAPYVSVGQKLSQAEKRAAQVAKKQNREPSPVKLQGKTIAKTFWGKAWCDNLTAYQDFSNRLPRGATYVRNGSVVDLVIQPKSIDAIVAGSEPYTVKIEIAQLDSKRWKSIRSECSESIDSLLDLLSGKLSDGVMKRLTDRKNGLFPAPSEIKMSCSCPDYSSCCKHLAAVMYGVAARLDSMPELLFKLRGVDHQELVSQAIAAGNLDRELSGSGSGGLGSQDLGALFGIELESTAVDSVQPVKKKRGSKKASSLIAADIAKPAQKSKSKVVVRKAAKGKPAPKVTSKDRAKSLAQSLAKLLMKSDGEMSGSATKTTARKKSAAKKKPAAKKSPVAKKKPAAKKKAAVADSVAKRSK